ncbi:MAG: YbbR-like domain-containing protein [bacterium]|jgi:YbbR domain-containing protein
MDKFLERHVAARLISIALAFFLWLFVVNEQNPEIDRTVVVVPQIRGMPADLILIEEVQPVSVRLRGRRNDIFNVGEEDLELYVNMAEAIEGENNPEVRLASMPTGVQVMEIIPSHLPVMTERIIQEQLELQLSITGQPARGYVLGEEVLNPNRVVVEGPRSKVEEIARALVRIDAAGATADIRFVVPVHVLDRQGNSLEENLEIRPEVVEVKIPVEILPSKALEIEPQLMGTPAEGYQVDEVIVDPPALEVYGRQEVLDRMTSLETAPLDISTATADISQELRLLLPEGVQSPRDRVRVTVKISPIKLEKTVQVPIRLHNLGEGLEAELQPQTVAVTLSGPFTAVNVLQAREVTASVDAAGLEIGEHRLKVRVILPSGIQRVALEPEEVLVIIREGGEEIPQQEEAG